ncbi:hypothetical protein Hanom_Chr16g01457011 [Helianthus anomalus]
MVFCRLNTKIGRVLRKTNVVELKILRDKMKDGGIMKTRVKTGRKTELKRKSYEENSFGKNLSDVGYGSGVAYGSVWTQILIKLIKNRF